MRGCGSTSPERSLENQRPHYEKLQALAAALHVENLLFLGARQDVPALMRHADIFVCTSKHESGPTVVCEALSMTKPVLSTDVGDVRELFEEHRVGRSPPAGSRRNLRICSSG